MLMRLLLVTVIGTGVVACGGSGGSDGIECVLDSHCNRQAGGDCVVAPSGKLWCAYPDAVCGSGMRFDSEDVGDDLAGECVAEELPDARAFDAILIDGGPADAALLDSAPADAGIECTPGIAFSTGGGSISFINADGSGLRSLTSQGTNRRPRWSPDGMKILFQSDRDGDDDVWVMDADGTNQINLTNTADEERQAVWSPDGTKVAFVRGLSSAAEVWVMNADGTGQTMLADSAEHPTWSADSMRVAYASFAAGPFEIFSVNSDGSALQNVSMNAASDARPQWSPDGTKIAFGSLRETLPELYVMNSNGGNQNSLSPGKFVAGFAWSPTGARIAFSGSTTFDVYVVDANGANLTNITQTNDAITESGASWAPDGQRIVFRRDSPATDIYIINVNGTGLTALAASPTTSEQEPHWSPCPE